jgi:ELWxxDGT repeat protein
MRRVSRVFMLLVLATFWAAARGTAAGTAELLRDINQTEGFGTGGTGVNGPLLPGADRVVFPAYTPNSGIELWGSDGTAQGTRLLREILPGPDSVRIRPLGTVRRLAVFLADDFSRHSFGLWRSDGTAEGTVQINPNVPPCFDQPESAVAANLLFFTAFTGEGCGVWKTDGATAAPLPGVDAGPGSRAIELTPAGNRLFFFLAGALWVTDGTPAGTRELEAFPFSSDTPRELTPAGSRVYFIAPGSTTGEEELWTSDGTAAGTRQVTRFFEPLPFQGVSSTPLLEGFEGQLYFVANDGTGLDLWRTDGTTAGTRRVTDFVSTSPFIESFNAEHLVRLGGLLVFPATDSQGTGWHLWASGGTPATTKPLSDCVGFNCPRVTGSLVQVGNRAVFAGYSEAAGTDLWVTDGTAAGTRRLDDLCASFCDRPPVLAPLLGKVFYVAADAQGLGLWRTDGTPRGTVRLTSLGFRPFEGGATFAPVVAGGRVYFAADPGNRGSQLWSSDGTPEGTGLVTLIHTSAPGSSPFGMAPFAGGVVFSANDGDELALWLSDGTTAGTRPIPDTEAPAGSDYPRPVVSNGLVFYERPIQPFGPGHLWRTDGTEAGTFRVTPDGVDNPGAIAPFGDGVIFLISDDNGNVSLWASDGTVAGTRLLFEMPTAPYAMWVSETRIYFLGIHGNYEQLWVSDGTLAGTRPLTSTNDYAFLERPELKEVGPLLFFSAQNRLWKSDGTAGGTAPVLPAGLEGSDPSSFVEFQGLLYFIANTAQGDVGRGLWRSDGTAAGTFLVRPVGPPINSESGRPELGWLTVAGNRLFFAAGDGEHGTELWKSDGTAAGTVMVRDVFPGAGSSRPSQLTAAQGRLYFVAANGASGFELWESDGTTAGTRRVQDVAPGAASSNPHALTVSGQRLFFVADDGVHGEEPWVLPLAGGGGCKPSTDTLCLGGGRFRVAADWRDFEGNRGTGTAVALTADTGYFWFFDAANVEVILKVLDGRGLNDHHWVFCGALSSVEYVLTVTDTQTGAVRRYVNPPGRLGSVADTEAFGPRGANVANPLTFGPAPSAAKEAGTARPGAAATEPATACVPSATRLCLNDGRFAVEARWKDFEGNTGSGKAVTLAGGDTGYFWFFDEDNVEVVLKVLDGRPLNGKFWVFYGALSSVEYTLTVTDTVTGTVKTYTNPSGKLASVADTGAF